MKLFRIIPCWVPSMICQDTLKHINLNLSQIHGCIQQPCLIPSRTLINLYPGYNCCQTQYWIPTDYLLPCLVDAALRHAALKYLGGKISTRPVLGPVWFCGSSRTPGCGASQAACKKSSWPQEG